MKFSVLILSLILLNLSKICVIQYILNHCVKFSNTKIMFIYVCTCSVSKSCLTLCDPVDYSLPDSSVHWIFQARILEWVSIFFSRGFIINNTILVFCLCFIASLMKFVTLFQKGANNSTRTEKFSCIMI